MEHAYDYEKDKVSTLLYALFEHNSTARAQQWLRQQWDKLQETGAVQRFNLTFTAIPRFTGKNVIAVTPAQQQALEAAVSGFNIQGYTLDRLARVWWLLQLPATGREQYVQAVEALFNAAEMNELVALYGALPLLPYPEQWKLRTAEGIRSNIGPVLEAVMLRNPYPARYLDEPAWNQLVMKAIFTEKPVHLISGLDERANPRLAAVLTDYAHERWAAGRTVNPMLWRLVGPFINDSVLPDIERVWHSEYNAEREAAALACATSGFAPAQALLQQAPALQQEIAAGKLTWDTVAQRI